VIEIEETDAAVQIKRLFAAIRVLHMHLCRGARDVRLLSIMAYLRLMWENMYTVPRNENSLKGCLHYDTCTAHMYAAHVS